MSDNESATIASAYEILKGHQHTGIWLEVSEVLLQGQLVFVKLIGDKAPYEPDWWLIESTFDAHRLARDESEKLKPQDPDEEAAKKAAELTEKAAKNAADLAKSLYDALDKKRLVLAKLAAVKEGKYLCATEIRIQSDKATTR